MNTCLPEIETARPYWLKEEGKNISPEDLDLAYTCSGDACSTILRHGPFERFKGDAHALISMFRDYKDGLYDRIPWGSVALIAFTLLYIVNPMDIIPDIAPVIGFIDDAGMLGICLKSVDRDLTDYRCWTSSFYYRYLKRKLNRKEKLSAACLPAQAA
ncbi:MAG: DUF1232 domain-containing protein [Desulfobacterales bacterium]|nr:DUF1232 domain-containing protein [Desulfobacterales bacterium]